MTALLQVEAIEVSYGSSQALFGIDFTVSEGQFVTLLGRNGMGKSTTVKAIMGLNRTSLGVIRFANESIQKLPSHKIAQAGIGLVPEGRHIFPTLTVRENLIATARNRLRSADPWTLARIYELFPRLQERQKNLGANLSGGEQQMLAIGRALMTNPRLLILDEATEGLAPLIRNEIWGCLARLKKTGLAIICVDKNLAQQMALADRHYVLAKGRVAWSGSSDDLRINANSLRDHLSI